jgi:integrase
VAKSTIHRLLSRRDIPLRERTLWRMLYETAARAAQILPLNVEDLDLEGRKAPIRAKGGAVQWVYWDTGTAHLLPLRLPDAVIAWPDAGQPEPDQTASRIGQAIYGAITAAQPATA